ncbi:MAG: hypothetical protein DRR16_16465 [Candidatus Parabeggiatoa sp. nov. 3]|nr:MAG: hypothetical protein DRR00_34210 [Gammaproteobacteria bacterium]RKZ62688.1 MAG: hypothetical protein DRQ99_18330 [Gammaproteobacteria bacterium]RKZ83764.1 MAG: hypothetical protein DRR16_16465 [Gammaproteobacteria bacterium]
MDGKQVIKKLNQHGWQVLRIRGSHHQLGKDALRTTVPVHSKRDLGTSLLKKSFSNAWALDTIFMKGLIFVGWVASFCAGPI